MIIRNIKYEELNSLDLMVSAPFIPSDRTGKIKSVIIRSQNFANRKLNDDEIKSLQIVAVEDVFPGISSFFSIGQKNEKNNVIEDLYLGYGRRNGITLGNLYLDSYNGSGYAVNMDDRSVYLGGGVSEKVLILDEPVSFNPEKELFFIRSPNEKVEFRDYLARTRIAESISLGRHIVGVENGCSRVYPLDSGTREHEKALECITKKGFLHKIDIAKPAERILAAHIQRWNRSEPAEKNGMYTRAYIEGNKDEFYFTDKEIKQIDVSTFDPRDAGWQAIGREDYLRVTDWESQLAEYFLVYENLEKMLEGRKWAFNSASFMTAEINAAYNMHLFG
ncbi:MAG: hypothetical protein AABX05_00730 [Nanoarchaeota archaeon]